MKNLNDDVSIFNKVKFGPTKYTQAFELTKAFREDTAKEKVNLGVGAYRTDEGIPWVFPVVRKVEENLAKENLSNKEYLPVLGLESFTNVSTRLILGEDSPAISDERVLSVQTLSGTGALRVGAEFIVTQLGITTYYSSEPTWENHELIFKNAGFKKGCPYRYWDRKKRSIDWDGLKEDLNNAAINSVILLHACAHNPTGSDPTREQWAEIADIIKRRRLFPFFDAAYQGFASGDLDNDAWAVRHFERMGFELICAQSYAKNFGLYNERIGNLVFVVSDKSVIPPIKSQLTLIIRSMYSNPPCHGARIVASILSSPSLRKEWETNLKSMATRISDMRKQLKKKLEENGTPGLWHHITNQIGMFSFTGLTQTQVEFLIEQCHIYLMNTGRISLSGINTNNIDHVAKCVHDAVVTHPD